MKAPRAALLSLPISLLAISLTLLANCGPIPPPVDPIIRPHPETTTVIDADTDTRIAGALGVLKPFDGTGPYEATSDAAGRLQFIVDPESTGGAWLTISAEGYQESTDDVELHLAAADLPAQHLHKLRPPVEPLARIRVEGRELFAGDRGLVMRGITAFRLNDYIADGEEDKARDYIQKAKAAGFNFVRVLSTLCCWFTISTAEGQAALPHLLTIAAEEGIYVELVALAGTAPDEGNVSPEQMRQHVQALGAICAQFTSCGLLEIANENADGTQHDILQNLTFLRELWRLIPTQVPVSCGSGPSDESVNYPGCGTYITLHGNRDRDMWNSTRRTREFELVSSRAEQFVVDDEWTGCGEVAQGGTRYNTPDPFYARAVLSRIFRVGATLHLQNGLHAIWPEPGTVQSQCIVAFIEGTRVLPEVVRPVFENARSSGSPVDDFTFDNSFGEPNTAIRAYSGIHGDRGITVAVGVTGDPGIRWGSGWKPLSVISDRPGVRVLEIGRQP